MVANGFALIVFTNMAQAAWVQLRVKNLTRVGIVGSIS